MKPPYKCSICNYETLEKSNLKRHFDSVHEKKKPHKCTICENSFSDKGGLKKHLDTVHGEKRKAKVTTKSSTQKTLT